MRIRSTSATAMSIIIKPSAPTHHHNDKTHGDNEKCRLCCSAILPSGTFVSGGLNRYQFDGAVSTTARSVDLVNGYIFQGWLL